MKKSNKVTAALAVFGGLFAQAGMFAPARGLKTPKKCLQCGKTHNHNNSFCGSYCCTEWRMENPNQGRANHSHDKDGEACRNVEALS